jgi:AraC-like DNA-binding protein
MAFVLHAVAPPLSGYINFLYQWQGPIPFPRDAIFPMPATDLKFNFADPWRVQQPGEGRPSSLRHESWCVGIWDRHHIVHYPVTPEFLGVSFRAGGAHAFLGIPLAELHNSVVSLDAIWGPFAAEATERLHAARTMERRFALAEEILLARLREKPVASPIVDHVAKRIAARHGAPRIGALCDEIGISHKHLITLFKQFVGCTPKELAQLHRFAHALGSIDVAKPVDWTSLAHDNDYFDQSHFTHDFEAYTGLNPTSYLKLRRSVGEQAHPAVLALQAG